MTKVMIVDDEEHIRTLYSLELEDEGYQVMTLESGEGISGRIKEFNPDVVILDIKMTGISGLDVLQEIRSEHYNLPVILCSAYGSYKGNLKSVAADYYVVKSSDTTELKNKIKAALEARIP